MDTALLLITTVSLAAAFASVTAVRRLKRSDQQRSGARVAALTAADSHTGDEGRWNQKAGEWQWNLPAQDLPRDEAGRKRFAPPARAVRSTPSVPPAAFVPPDNLFGTVRREPQNSWRFGFVAVAVLLVALGGAVVVFTTSGHGKAGAQGAQAEPLELVALGHSREANTLTITGTVRAPAAGPKREELTAVVSLIDGNGGLISTKDVPLDYRALGPGEEAPFKVTVPDPGSVARYRVSFRAGADVVPHVDRRGHTKLASAS